MSVLFQYRDSFFKPKQDSPNQSGQLLAHRRKMSCNSRSEDEQRSTCSGTIHTELKSAIESGLKTWMLREKRSLSFEKKRHDVRIWCKWQESGENDGEACWTLYAKPITTVAAKRMKVILASQHERKCGCWTSICLSDKIYMIKYFALPPQMNAGSWTFATLHGGLYVLVFYIEQYS